MTGDIRTVAPEGLVKSKYNIHSEAPEEDEGFWKEIKENVAEQGIKVRPIVRMEDGKQAVVDGWHRVRAAQEADLETIEVDFREEMDDVDAMLTSFTANEDHFQKEMDPFDRAFFLREMWEATGGEGVPSAPDLGEMLSVPRSTVNYWLEPLRREWEGTFFDPTSENCHLSTVDDCRKLGMRDLSLIRNITGGGDDGVWLVQQKVEHDLSRKDLSAVRDYFAKGARLQDAVDIVRGEVDFEDLNLNPGEGTETRVVESGEVDRPSAPASTSTTKEEKGEEEKEPEPVAWVDGEWADEQPGDPHPAFTDPDYNPFENLGDISPEEMAMLMLADGWTEEELAEKYGYEKPEKWDVTDVPDIHIPAELWDTYEDAWKAVEICMEGLNTDDPTVLICVALYKYIREARLIGSDTKFPHYNPN